MIQEKPEELRACEIFTRDRNVFLNRLPKVLDMPSLVHSLFNDICVHSQIWGFYPDSKYLSINIHEIVVHIAKTQITCEGNGCG